MRTVLWLLYYKMLLTVCDSGGYWPEVSVR